MRRQNPCSCSTAVAVTLSVFLLFFTLITLYLFAAKYWRPPDPITSFGREIDQQFARTFLITGIVFVLSQLALGWVVFRFRDTGGRATFSHGNTTMEVLWTLATLVLFVGLGDRKSTRLNSSHGYISYAVFCLKKKKKKRIWNVYLYKVN